MDHTGSVCQLNQILILGCSISEAINTKIMYCYGKHENCPRMENKYVYPEQGTFIFVIINCLWLSLFQNYWLGDILSTFCDGEFFQRVYLL
jgi:hypothetical protein